MSDELEKLRSLANRVHVSLHDVEEALQFAETFKMLRGNPAIADIPSHGKAIEASLGMAAIVSYGRPFVASQSNGVADRLLKTTELGLFNGKPDLEASHDLFLMLRQKVVAHSDWQFRFSAVNTNDAWQSSIRQIWAFDPTLLLTNFYDFIDLARHVRNFLTSQLMKLDLRISNLADQGGAK
ncbi:hypothetical protein ABID97_002993 [Variovorax sp. OAS795]|uniref:hypothetical protein n=1 Tax=Variovorax sp. OAS795 TaxID=3034231 RepID=UPI003391D2C3